LRGGNSQSQDGGENKGELHLQSPIQLTRLLLTWLYVKLAVAYLLGWEEYTK